MFDQNSNNSGGGMGVSPNQPMRDQRVASGMDVPDVRVGESSIPRNQTSQNRQKQGFIEAAIGMYAYHCDRLERLFKETGRGVEAETSSFRESELFRDMQLFGLKKSGQAGALNVFSFGFIFINMFAGQIGDFIGVTADLVSYVAVLSLLAIWGFLVFYLAWVPAYYAVLRARMHVVDDMTKTYFDKIWFWYSTSTRILIYGAVASYSAAIVLHYMNPWRIDETPLFPAILGLAVSSVATAYYLYWEKSVLEKMAVEAKKRKARIEVQNKYLFDVANSILDRN